MAVLVGISTRQAAPYIAFAAGQCVGCWCLPCRPGLSLTDKTCDESSNTWRAEGGKGCPGLSSAQPRIDKSPIPSLFDEHDPCSFDETDKVWLLLLFPSFLVFVYVIGRKKAAHLHGNRIKVC